MLLAGIFLILVGFFIGRGSSENIYQPPVSKVVPSVSVKNTSAPDSENTEKVIITKVIDGDTVETSSGEKIRYLGVNAPEKGQPKSSEATELNKSLVLNKEVSLEFDVQQKDRYGRTLAYVFDYSNNRTTFINLKMVERGLAVSETVQPNVKYQDAIVKTQEKARENCLGIWQGLCKDDSVLGAGSKSCIKIISINADAPGNDNQNKNGEWIEIKNTCQEKISMKGWLLKDNSASNKYEFRDFALEGNKMLIVYSGCGQDSESKLYWQCPEGRYSIWNNSSDHAFLYNEKGDLVSDYQY